MANIDDLNQKIESLETTIENLKRSIDDLKFVIDQLYEGQEGGIKHLNQHISHLCSAVEGLTKVIIEKR